MSLKPYFSLAHSGNMLLSRSSQTSHLMVLVDFLKWALIPLCSCQTVLPLDSSLSITWELIANANSQAHFSPTQSETVGVGSSKPSR